MIALIGERELWQGFSPLGVKIFEVKSKDDVLDCFNELNSLNYRIVFISDYVANLIYDDLEKITNESDFNIILMPSLDLSGKKSTEDLYLKRLKKVAEKAMGIDVLS